MRKRSFSAAKKSFKSYKQNKLIELFVAGVTARTAAQLVGINKNTAAYYFHRLRLLIYYNSPHLEMFDGEVEVDKLFRRTTQRSRCGWQSGCIRAFEAKWQGLYRCRTQSQTVTLSPIIREQVKPDSIVYTDCYKSYDVLDVSEFSHFRINHSTHLLNDKITLTELRTFGTKQNVICVSLMAFPKSILSCI